MTHLIEYTAAWFGVTPAEIVSHNRARHLVRPRWVLAYVMRRRTGLSYPQIGQLMNRDHSSIIHACRKTWLALDHDAEIQRAVEHLMQVEHTRFRPPGLGMPRAPGISRAKMRPEPIPPAPAPAPKRPAYAGKARNDFDQGNCPETQEYLQRAAIRKGSATLLAALQAV